MKKMADVGEWFSKKLLSSITQQQYQYEISYMIFVWFGSEPCFDIFNKLKQHTPPLPLPIYVLI